MKILGFAVIGFMAFLAVCAWTLDALARAALRALFG